MSDAIVVLRLSNNREGRTGFIGQSVRHDDDLQRRKSPNLDRSSIGLMKMGEVSGFSKHEAERERERRAYRLDAPMQAIP
jgi:hypothetical protein